MHLEQPSEPSSFRVRYFDTEHMAWLMAVATRAMNSISVRIRSGFVVVDFLFVIQYGLHASGYRFPLEMGGLAYRSAAHCVGVASATVV